MRLRWPGPWFYVVSIMVGFSLWALVLEVSAQQPPPTMQMRVPCISYEGAADKLREKFRETLVGIGVGHDQKTVWELYASKDGSWTMLVVRNDGMACLAGAGQRWTVAGEPGEGLPQAGRPET